MLKSTGPICQSLRSGGRDAALNWGARMLGRLMAWCVPASVLQLRPRELDLTNVEQALGPYQSEPPAPVPDTVLHLPRRIPAS